MELSIADAKSERGAVLHAIRGSTAITMVIESYHGFPWADEIGTVESQAITSSLVRRAAWLDREIKKYKAAIKSMTNNLNSYEATNE